MNRARLEVAFGCLAVATAATPLALLVCPERLLEFFGWHLYTSTAGAAILLGAWVTLGSGASSRGARRRLFWVLAVAGMVGIEALVNQRLGTWALFTVAALGSGCFFVLSMFDFSLLIAFAASFVVGHITVPLVLVGTQEHWPSSMHDPRTRFLDSLARIGGGLLVAVCLCPSKSQSSNATGGELGDLPEDRGDNS